MPAAGPEATQPATTDPALSCEDWLGVVGPRLSPALIDDEGHLVLTTLARFLPGPGIHVAEARLGAESRDVDLSTGLQKPEASDFFLGQSDFLRRWRARELAPVEAVWLELDGSSLRSNRLRSPDAVPQPVVCARLDRAAAADESWLAGTLLPALVGRPLRDAEASLLHRALTCLPASGRVLYAFDLRARGRGAAIRLELFGLGPDDIVAYLGRLAPERRAQVERVLPLFDGYERHHLSFDLADDGVGRRVGVEFGLRRLPRREPRWRALFDGLEAAGLCVPEKARGALSWPGYDTRESAPERWPGDAPGYCVRGLSHVKLSTWPDREPEAKVYLLFQHLASRDALRRRTS